MSIGASTNPGIFYLILCVVFIIAALLGKEITSFQLPVGIEVSFLPLKLNLLVRLFLFGIGLLFGLQAVWTIWIDRDTVDAKSNQTFSVPVSGFEGWQSTGIEVKKGQQVKIAYSAGNWAVRVGYGPSFPDIWTDANGIDHEIYYDEFEILARSGSLIAKIGPSPVIRIGNYAEFSSEYSGILQLRMHDNDVRDNYGSIIVKIEISDY